MPDRLAAHLCGLVALALLLVAGILPTRLVLAAPPSCTPAPRANCAGVNLSRADLSGRDLSGINLAGANLTGANIDRTVLNRANLSGATMTGVKLFGSQLEAVDLSRAKLDEAAARQANFANANMTNANLLKSDFTGANFYGVTFVNTDFAHANVNTASFTGATFRNVNANGTDFFDTNLHANQMNVNVEASRSYYNVYVHFHINYYGRCKGANVGGCRAMGSCTNHDSFGNGGTCNGVAENMPHAHGYVGNSELVWSNVPYQFAAPAWRRCETRGYGWDRMFWMRASRAWICGLIPRNWWEAIIRWGDANAGEKLQEMRSGTDLARKGEPGGAFYVFLSYAGASTDGYDGYVLGMRGYVHVGP